MIADYGNNFYLPPSTVKPQFLTLSAITNASTCQVTVTEPNSFVIGQLIYFSVPFSHGMFQINGQTGKITSVTGDNLIFKVDINTENFDVFAIPGGSGDISTISPSGSRNIYNNTTVPYHSEGNTGN